MLNFIKSKFHFVLRIMILVLIIAAGCSEEGPTEVPIVPEGVKTSGNVVLPSNINQIKVVSGLNTGEVKDGKYSIYQNENVVQLISITDLNDNPLLLGVNITGSKDSSYDISPQTTAEALIFMNPFLCTSDINETRELKTIINSLSSFNLLVDEINSQLNTGTINLSEQNTTLVELLQEIYGELFEVIANGPLNKLNAILQKEQTEPDPNFNVNGLEVTDYSESNNNLDFKISNSHKRWISVYVDKSVDGINYEYSEFENVQDIIPSTNISLLNYLFHGNFAPPEVSRAINVDNSNYKVIAAKCYGLGIGMTFNDREFSRTIFPAVMTGVFDLFIPVVEVSLGLHLIPELRGRPADNPIYKLVSKVALEFVQNTAKKNRIYTFFREGDIAKVLLEIAGDVVKTCAENPTYLADLLKEAFGAAVTRSFVSSWLFPLRLANAGITVINLGYTVSHIFSSESVTTFVFDKSVTQPPVKVEGLIYDYQMATGINNATITCLDANDNLISTTTSDPSGHYQFYISPGNISIRVVAAEYKPVTNNFVVPEDILNQNPIIFYPPTIYMVPFSSLSGNIDGQVRDATTLSPINGVLIKLRYGVDDPEQPILKELTTQTNGNFYFNEIPSGTYTAFFEKEGYINDKLVISVVGSQTTSGVYFNLSPNIMTTSGYRIILTWGENPNDLDSHLFTPSIQGNSYHIYYASKGNLYSPPFVELDVDDVSSYGPETVTISQLYPGEYYYSIHHFAGSGNLASSNAEINLYGINGFIRKWNVPITGDGIWWNVFSINGSNGTITSINKIEDNPRMDTGALRKIQLEKKY